MEAPKGRIRKSDLEKLVQRSVLSHFPAELVRSSVLPNLKHLTIPEGELVPRTDTPDAVYIVAQGRVGLLNGEYQIGTVEDGRVLELARVVEGETTWLYQWKALSECTILHFSRAILQKAFAKDRDLATYLRRMVGSRAIQRFKHDMGLLGFSVEQSRETIIALTEISNLGLSKRASRDGIVIVESGAFEVESRAGGGLFRAGDAFTITKEADPDLTPQGPGKSWVIDRKVWEELVGGELVESAFSTLASSFEQDSAEWIEKRSLELEGEAEEEEDEDEESDGESEEDDTDEVAREFPPDPSTAARRSQLSKIPLVVQHDQMDCGAACLSMVAKFYGKHLNIARLRGMLGVSVDGSSLADIIRASELLGIKASAVEVGLEGLADLRLPAIALMEHHFVVLFQVEEDHVVLSDPGIGRLRISHEEFERSYSGISVLMIPERQFAQLRSDTVSFLRYAILLKGEGGELARAGATVLLLFVLNLTYPLFMQMLFDEVLLRKNIGLLGIFLAGFAAISLIRVTTEMVRDYLFLKFAARFDAKISSLFLRHSMALPFSYFAIRRTGDFLSRMEELEKIRVFMSGKSFVLMINVLSIGVFGWALYLYHPAFLIVVLAGLPLYAWIVVRVSSYLQQLLDQRFVSHARADSKYLEAITNLETVQLQNYAISTRWRWESEIVKGMSADKKYQYAAILSDGALEALEYSFNAAILLLAVYLHGIGQLSVGQVVAVGAIGTQLLGPVLGILKEWRSISEVAVSFSKIDDVFRSRRENMRQVQIHHQLQGEIEIRDVSFRYGGEGSPTVLDHINLTIKAGESIALVGPSGSGKSSLAHMFNMLYHPSEGQVFFDGRPGDELDLEDMRRQVGMILQDNNIFTGTVLENIALGDKTPSMKRAIEAAKLADAHEFISKLNKGYLHPLTPTPDLSGGERQRLCIARAFYLNPKILIMDEATSALDSISEQRILRNLETSRKKMTTVTIAHRLDSIVQADRIIVLVKGRVAEDGTHRTLMRKRGVYYHLFKKQLSA